MQGQDSKRLLVKCFQPDSNSLQVTITDSGIGMSDDQYANLYEPFSSTKTTGLGVGLSISRSIIAHHEGRIWAEPNLPQGTSFHLTLPVA